MFLLPQLHLFLIAVDICICVVYLIEEKLMLKKYFFSVVICKMKQITQTVKAEACTLLKVTLLHGCFSRF